MTPKSNDDQAAMLARIDERTLGLERGFADLSAKLDNQYVTRAEFNPVKAIVYGLVGLILTAVVVSLLALVVSGEPGARAAQKTTPWAREAAQVMP